MNRTEPHDVAGLFERAGSALDVDTHRLRADLERALAHPSRGTGDTRHDGSRTRRPRPWMSAAAAVAAVAVTAAGVTAWRTSPVDGARASLAAPAGGGSTESVPALPLPPLPDRTTDVAPHVLAGTPTLPRAQRTIDNLEPSYVPGASRTRVKGTVTPVLAYDNGYRQRIWAVAPGFSDSGERSVCWMKIVDDVDIDDPGMWDQSILCMQVPRAGRLTGTGKATLLYEGFDSIPAERGKSIALSVVSDRATACAVQRGGTTTPLDHRVPVTGTDYAFVYGLIDPDDRGLLTLSCTT
ncbi:hypothetical protein [Terrabacter sp. C0L_2]|uniref:hypothetical protein n=1 Tax=Terrabacter sp. C0L_2 TaxID=3108389 RepID=UPI002ED418AA|nr:hypothetical protein U5C87_20760 [Terrabacter sp. C0L_2]